MREGNIAGLLHSMREHGVARRCEDGHSSQHQILAKGHGKSGSGLAACFEKARLATAPYRSQKLKWLQTLNYAFIGSAAAAASSLCCFTILLRARRSFRKVLASLYKRLRSLLSNIALRRMRKAALGRK